MRGSVGGDTFHEASAREPRTPIASLRTLGAARANTARRAMILSTRGYYGKSPVLQRTETVETVCMPIMPDRPFNAEEFVALMNRGVFEGRVTESIEKLSYEQLVQVASVMASQSKVKPTI
jgi:hypothetical protein